MFQNIGFTELLLIAVVALVLFGPQKLPEIGRMLGKTLRDFKQAANELMQDEPKAPLAKPAPITPVAPDPVSPVSMASVAVTNVASEASTSQMAPEAKTHDEVIVVAQAAEAASEPSVKPAVAFRTNKSADVVQVAGTPSEAKATNPSANAASTEQVEADVLSAVPATAAEQQSGSKNNTRQLPD